MADYREEFRRLFETTFISGKGSEERIAAEMETFLESVIKVIPDSLFRFRKLDESGYAMKSFKNGTISLCKASCFSDKYDSLVYVNVEKEIAEMEYHLKQAMQIVMKHIKEKNPLIRAEKASEVCFLLEQGMTEEEVIETMIETKYSGFLEEMRRDLKCRELRFRNSESTARIACFTENVRSKYMWDAYAGSYRGFALEYNLKEYVINCIHKDTPVHVFPVIYSDERPDVTKVEVNEYYLSRAKKEGWSNMLRMLKHYMDLNMLYPYIPFLYKDKEEYGHEKEWRLLYYNDNNKEDEDERSFRKRNDCACDRRLFRHRTGLCH